MDERPSIDPDILEAIEVFRSGETEQEDLALQAVIEAARSDPNLAEHLRRVERWDRRCAEAMREVAVPADLAARIVEVLERKQAVPPPREPAVGDRTVEIGCGAPAPRDALAPTTRRRSWRRIVVAATIAAAATVVLMVLAPDGGWSGPDELCRTAISLFDIPMPAVNEGFLVSQVAPPEDYPYSSHLLSVPEMRWRSVDEFGRSHAVAYDLPLRGQRRATLYVLRGKAEGLPATPPRQSQLQTRNLAVAAWQSGDLIYVLVADGGEGAYRALLESTARPWT